MSGKYKFHNPEGLYFVSFATIHWIDVFVRRIYCDILVASLKYCIKEKGMLLYAWCIMPSHIHLIFRSTKEEPQRMLQDSKKHTSKKVIQAKKDKVQESRREWLIRAIKRAGKKQVVNINFGNTEIDLLNHGVMKLLNRRLIIFMKIQSKRVLFRNLIFGNIAVPSIIVGVRG